jgi:hypothetical protein
MTMVFQVLIFLCPELSTLAGQHALSPMHQLSSVWQAVLMRISPHLKELQKLKHQWIGRLTNRVNKYQEQGCLE